MATGAQNPFDSLFVEPVPPEAPEEQNPFDSLFVEPVAEPERQAPTRDYLFSPTFEQAPMPEMEEAPLQPEQDLESLYGFEGLFLRQASPEEAAYDKEMARLEAEDKDQSIFRQLADYPIKLQRGITSGLKMISDAFGADNAISKDLQGSTERLTELLSAQARMDDLRMAEIKREAEEEGTLDQLIASAKAYSVAPFGTTVELVGTSLPTLLASALSFLTGGTAPTLIAGGIGVTQGLGVVKGQIYDTVYEELVKSGVDKEKAKLVANEAQAYEGENLDVILGGGGLGLLASRTGIEKSVLDTAMRRVRDNVAKSVAKNAAAREALGVTSEEAAKKSFSGLLTRRAFEEAIPELLQAGEEQFAGNLALQRQGFDVDLMRGVPFAAGFEGLAGGVTGGVAGGIEYAAQPQAKLERELNKLRKLQREAELRESAQVEEGVEEVVDERAGQPDVGGPEPSVSVPSGEAAPTEPAAAVTEPTGAGVGVSGVSAVPTGAGDAGVGAPLTTEEQIVAEAEALQREKDAEAAAEAAPTPADMYEAQKARIKAMDIPTTRKMRAEAALEKVSSLKIDLEDIAFKRQAIADYEAGTPQPAYSTPGKIGGLKNSINVKTRKINNTLNDLYGRTWQQGLSDAERANVFSSILEGRGAPLEPSAVTPAPTPEAAPTPAPEAAPAPTPTAEPAPTVAETAAEVAPVEGAPVEPEAELEAEEVVSEEAGPPAEVVAVPEAETEEELIAPKPRRGRKKVARTPEEQAAYDADRKARQSRLTKANRTAKAAADILNAPLPKPTDFATEGEREQFIAGYMSMAERNLANAFRIQADPELRGTKARKQADEILNNPVLRAPQMQQLRRAAQARAQQDPELESAKMKPVKDATRITNEKLGKTTRDESLGKFNNANDALKHIIKTGNAFERALAERLLPLVKDIPILVLRGPEQTMRLTTVDAQERTELYNDFLRNAYKAIYIEPTPSAEAAQGVVILNDQPNTDAKTNGLNNVTLLHELVHAATSLVMVRAEIGEAFTPTQRNFVESMSSLYDTVFARYDQMDIDALVEVVGSVENAERLAGLMDLARENTREFVAYGMTEPLVQQFLGSMEGGFVTEAFVKQAPSMWTNFVAAIRKLLGLDTKYGSALLDLVTLTEQLLVSEEGRRAEKGIDGGVLSRRLTAEFKLYEMLGLEPDSKPIIDAARTAKKAAAEDKVYKRVSDAVENVKRSERATGADRNAIGLLADAMMNFVRGTSSADYVARVFRTIKDNIPSRMIPTFLGFMDSNDITRMYGTELPVLKEVRKMLDHMGAYQTKRLQEVEKVVIDWGELTARHPEASKFLNRLLAITTKFDVDVLRNKTYAEALQNDEELKLLQAAVAKDPNNSAAKREMNERMQELKIVYQGYTDPDGYEIVGWDRLNTMANGWASRVGRKSLEAYEEAREEYFTLLKKNLEDSMLPEEGKQQVLAQINEMMAEARKRPGYSPLQRFGQYWVRIGKRTDAQFIMFESPVQRDLYVQEYLQGKDMEALAAAGEIAIGDNTNEMREYMRLNSDMLKDMFSAIDNLSGNLVNTAGMDVATATKATADAAQELKNVVYDFYLRTLPEQDIRRRFTRRKGTAGYSTDFLRVFATQMFSTSNQLGRLKFQQPVYAALSGAKDNLQGRVDKRARRLRSVLNEFTLRANSEVTSAPQTPWDQFASLATKGTFFYLLSSPRSALIQFSQVPNVGFPVLVSKGYGTGNITKKFAKYLNVFQTLRLPEQEVDGSFEVKVGTPVMVTSPAVRNDPVLQWAWNYADRSNVFMSTYTGALWGRTRTSSERYTDPSKRAGRMVGTLMTGLFHSTEHLSRQFMFMVSFELELDRLVKKGIPREEAKYAAADTAVDRTLEALLDYGQFNKARYLKKPLLRVGTQFYSYGIQMMSLLTRSAYKMIKGIGDAEAQQIKQDLLEKGLGEIEATRQARKLALERTKEIRREAAIQFWGISLTTGITAGVTGLPMYYLIVGLMEALRAAGWEDDEDPFLDPATKKRIPIDALWRYYSIPRLGGDISQALGLSDEWGKKVSDLIKYGAPSAITGLDMSNPISLSNLLMLGSPQADSTRDFLTQATFRLLGPAGASIDSIGRGIEEIFVNGDSRGWEKLSPALFRGGPRAYRLATEGEITPTQRDVVLAKDQFTLGLLVGQSIGFNPLDLVDLKGRNYEALKLQRQVKKEKAEILDELNRAYVYYVSDPDNEGYKERYIDALRAVEGYNLEFYNFKDPITTDTIQKSLTGRAKSRAEAIQGAPLEAGYREALMPLFLPTLPKE